MLEAMGTRRGESDYQRRLGKVLVQLRGLNNNMSAATLAERLERSEAGRPFLAGRQGKAAPRAFDLHRIAVLFGLDRETLDLLIFPPNGPVSPVAERLAEAAARGVRRGLGHADRGPTNGKGD